MQSVGAHHPIVQLAKGIMKDTFDSHSSMHFITEGIWEHELLLDSSSSTTIESTICCPPLLYTESAHKLVGILHTRVNSLVAVSERVYSSLSDRDSPDGLISICRKRRECLDTLAMREQSVVLILDGLRTAGNVGALIRTADGVGADAVIAVNRGVRLNNSGVVKSSKGSFFSMPLVEAASYREVIAWLDRHGYAVIVTDPHANLEFDALPPFPRAAIVAGNERHGASEEWNSAARVHRASIPMSGRCDSLNVSIAASIVLYDVALRNRRIYVTGKASSRQGSPIGEPSVSHYYRKNTYRGSLKANMRFLL